jgi:hypothetical protein
LPVDMDIRKFGTDKKHNVVRANADQYLITSTVKRFIIVPVYLKLLDLVIKEGRREMLTFEPIIEEAWTHML